MWWFLSVLLHKLTKENFIFMIFHTTINKMNDTILWSGSYLRSRNWISLFYHLMCVTSCVCSCILWCCEMTILHTFLNLAVKGKSLNLEKENILRTLVIVYGVSLKHWYDSCNSLCKLTCNLQIASYTILFVQY